MIPVAAEAAFLGQAFLTPHATALRSLAREFGLNAWEAELTDMNGELELEYNRLFLNPAGSPCSLWQSANSEEARLMADDHLSALDWYRSFGVEPSASNDPADHIGLLLLFYARLIGGEAGQDIVAEFRADHLAWLPAFCECVERETRLEFYRKIARRLQALLVAG